MLSQGCGNVFGSGGGAQSKVDSYLGFTCIHALEIIKFEKMALQDFHPGEKVCVWGGGGGPGVTVPRFRRPCPVTDSSIRLYLFVLAVSSCRPTML